MTFLKVGEWSEVALTITKALGGGYNVSNRYMVGGIDNALVGRITGNAGTQNLALVSDYQGSSVSAIKRDGSVEQQAVYFTRSAFGMLERSSGTGGGTNSQTGYTGASTPNATSGFTYLRNRWYDPATGRFLTQDPIGLAGGVNLYAYAGNNPVGFADPFGLCKDKVREGAICVDLFISAKTVGVWKGDGRTFDANAAPSQSRVQMYIMPSQPSASFFTASPSCFAVGGGCHNPSDANRMSVSSGEGGSVTATFNFTNSAKEERSCGSALVSLGIAGFLDFATFGVGRALKSAGAGLKVANKILGKVLGEGRYATQGVRAFRNLWNAQAVLRDAEITSNVVVGSAAMITLGSHYAEGNVISGRTVVDLIPIPGVGTVAAGIDAVKACF